MRCTICKKTSDEIQLFSGILDTDMVMVCEACAESEGIPIIRKPSETQLNQANKRYSVRERMERISGVRNKTEISEESMITQGNLAKLRAPPKKQKHEAVLDNYYWILGMSRKRKKITLNHLANKMGVTPEIIRKIERGQLPENFEELFVKLEAYLGIKLLRVQTSKVNFVRNNRDAENEILEKVKMKMKDSPRGELLREDEKSEQLEKLEKGELDLSKRKTLFNLTLNDLVDIKKRREARIAKRKAKEDEDAMIGDDLDVEIEEL